MTKKIFRSILISCTATLLASLFFIVGILYNHFMTVQGNQLKSQLHIAAQGIEHEGNSFFDGLSEKEYRLTLIDKNGNVLRDTAADSVGMENHADRKEVREALETGSGESVRFSSTLLQKTMYYALRLSDGSVLRISTTQYSVVTLVLGILQPIIFIFVLAVILSAFLASKMAKKIVNPLNNLDLDNPLDNDIYDEISPFLAHIEKQRREIAKQIDKLKKNQDEFSAIIANMKEGIVLLGSDGRILSINNTAKKVFSADDDCIGKDFLTVERRSEIIRAIEKASCGEDSNAVITQNGRVYQVSVSAIEKQSDKSGLVILTFDVTDRTFAERNRREFTANVSHELKTPLQSIMGSAELIGNGLVKQEDMPRFVKNIQDESARLLTLIEDIIRLSQLDEKSEMPFENTDLFAVAADVVKELEPSAQKYGVKISLFGETTPIYSVKRLLHEIVFNLCENSIKYNRKNGEVNISVSSDNENAVISVADNGIGILPENQSRIFERFYRVDKSHSRENGSTGLGLSIVKHAAEYLDAKIKLDSEYGKGTVITVTLHRKT